MIIVIYSLVSESITDIFMRYDSGIAMEKH